MWKPRLPAGAGGVFASAGRMSAVLTILAIGGLGLAVSGCSRKSVSPLRIGLTDGGWGATARGPVRPDGGVRLALPPAGPRSTGRYKIGRPYRVGGRWYHPRHDTGYDTTGIASWYGPKFHKRRTANGEIFDMHRLTAAHPTLPLPSYVKVTNLANRRSIIVRVNDRGPYSRNRIIDLSYYSARALGFIRSGTTRVRVTYHGPAPLNGNDQFERAYLAKQGWFRSANLEGPFGPLVTSVAGWRFRLLKGD